MQIQRKWANFEENIFSLSFNRIRKIKLFNQLYPSDFFESFSSSSPSSTRLEIRTITVYFFRTLNSVTFQVIAATH